MAWIQCFKRKRDCCCISVIQSSITHMCICFHVGFLLWLNSHCIVSHWMSPHRSKTRHAFLNSDQLERRTQLPAIKHDESYANDMLTVCLLHHVNDFLSWSAVGCWNHMIRYNGAEPRRWASCNSVRTYLLTDLPTWSTYKSQSWLWLHNHMHSLTFI